MAIGFTKIKVKSLNDAYSKLFNDIQQHGITFQNSKGLKNQSITVENPYANVVGGGNVYSLAKDFFKNYNEYKLFDHLFYENIPLIIFQNDIYSVEKLIVFEDKGIIFNFSLFVIEDEMQMVANFGKLDIKDLQPIFFQCSLLLILLADFWNFKAGEVTITSQLFSLMEDEIIEKKSIQYKKFDLTKEELDSFFNSDLYKDLDTVVYYDEDYSSFIENFVHLSNLENLKRNGNMVTYENYYSENKEKLLWG